MLSVDKLRAALAELPNVDGDVIARGKPIAARLCQFLEENRAGSNIAEVYAWAFNVEFVLNDGTHWAIECLSPDAFRMYPGFDRGGGAIVWANIWVRESDLTVDELTQQINNEAFRSKEEFGHA